MVKQSKTLTFPPTLLMAFRFRFGLLILAFAAGCDQSAMLDVERSDSAATEIVAGTVQLDIDFAGEAENLSVKVPCSADSTVFTILQRAAKMDDLQFDSQGSGSTAFVHSIDGVMNAGGRGKNWVYRVNDLLVNESCGLKGVVPGDQIKWKYGEYKPEAD